MSAKKRNRYPFGSIKFSISVPAELAINCYQRVEVDGPSGLFRLALESLERELNARDAGAVAGGPVPDTEPMMVTCRGCDHRFPLTSFPMVFSRELGKTARSLLCYACTSAHDSEHQAWLDDQKESE